MKLNALLLDLDVLGEDAWAYLERVCGMLPDLGVIVCTGRSTVAQRVRGLRLGVDDWIAKPCHPEEVMARIEAVVAPPPPRAPAAEAGPLVVGELEIRADQFQAFVGGGSLDLTRREFELLHAARRRQGPGARARGDLPARLGLRDGPRRSLGRRLHPQAAPEAREALARAGATSTPTSASATASIPSRQRARWRRERRRRRFTQPEPPPTRAGFTSRSQQLYGRVTLAGLPRHAQPHGGESAYLAARRSAGDQARGARGAGRRPAAEPDGARAAAADHPRRAPAADPHPRGALRRGLGREPRHADRSVDVYVSRLRSKLGEALPEQHLIHTHNGIGYRFSPDG